ncbi:MAG TPA: sulfite exporter TauE/SafE family protein [Holophagaceae bacterium]|jgi:sulfite exporter TauE/SafE|nr:sulfite exporter TauE/SafE family protein [Holophagaceae bacterium]
MLEHWLNMPHAAPWLLVMWVAGLLGSIGHCAGMCGPIVAAFGVSQAKRGGRMWPRHLLFQLGRVATYTMLGAAIGFLGGFARIQSIQDMHECCRPDGAALVAAQAWPWQVWVKLAIGFLMLLLGLFMLLGRRADALMEFKLPQAISNLLGRGLRGGGGPWMLGMAWGLIPCGLVYMMLLKTLDYGSWRMGAAGMAAFGLGNMPLLLGLGLLSTKLSQAWKQRLLRLGGLLVAAMGGYIIWQAVTLLRLQGL